MHLMKNTVVVVHCGPRVIVNRSTLSSNKLSIRLDYNAQDLIANLVNNFLASIGGNRVLNNCLISYVFKDVCIQAASLNNPSGSDGGTGVVGIVQAWWDPTFGIN